MIESGWIDEVKQLLENGVEKNAPAMSSIGYREVISYLDQEELAHTPSIKTSVKEKGNNNDDQFLKIVKNITSKGFIRSNYKEKLVDLSDVRINLKSKT